MRLFPASSEATLQGFDFTLHMRRLCADMAGRLPELSHVDMSRVAIRFCQVRRAVRYGLQASLTPLRFKDGALTAMRGGRSWTVQRIFDSSGREMLYLLSFYLPRFLEHPLEEKLSIVIHELWHISPEFSGDLRRHAGRCYAHSHSQKAYDAQMDALAGRWLSLNPPPDLYDFLHHNFRGLQKTRGPVFGMKIPTPKLVRAG
jgi:predicted metallopeptidase